MKLLRVNLKTKPIKMQAKMHLQMKNDLLIYDYDDYYYDMI